MGFWSLQHSRVRRSTYRRLPTTCYVPPSGFGYPLDGLLPPSPCRLCFTPAALMGFALRSFPLSQGIRAFPPGSTHTPFHLPFNRHPKATGRPDRPRFLGFDPCESPWRPSAGLARQPLAAPLGFALLGSANRSLGRTLARPPLTRFAGAPRKACPPALQSIDRLLPDPVHDPQRTTDPGRDNPFRVFAPTKSQTFGWPAARAIHSPQAASCITVDRRLSLGSPPSYRSGWDRGAILSRRN